MQSCKQEGGLDLTKFASGRKMSDGGGSSSLGNINAKYHCPMCNYFTTTKSNLDYHLSRHTGEKPFKCAFCPYRSASQCNIKIHQKNHNTLKKFTCSLCNFSTDGKGSLTSHSMWHKQD